MERRGEYLIQARPQRDSEERERVSYSVKHASSGEVMHSAEDPVRESRKLYIEQPNLPERYLQESPLVIWDVGLGAAFNAMNVIHSLEEQNASVRAPVTLVSFEHDLDPLRLALGQRELFPHLNHPAPELILQTGRWSGVGCSWHLFFGDFRDTFASAPIPTHIFYDPFSYKVDSPLWHLSFFKRLWSYLVPAPVELFTYSASTAVRVTLLTAGFFVAKGVGTGLKKETTVALTTSAASGRYSLLDSSWLDRWERSSAQLPLSSEPTSLDEVRRSVKNHPQFARENGGVPSGRTCASHRGPQ